MQLTEHQNNSIRNLAIIAHVDHGKTTLVDALLKQGSVFRDHQQVGELIMDTNPLERERGITIMAKNASVSYGDVRINIIDTPGHADFGGEVERVMNMADGCLLLVDAVDGPMPQTTHVLRQALRQSVTPMVVINKIDRPEARVAEVVEKVQDLFLELATEAEQLDFPVVYASARQGYATAEPDSPGEDMKPLFDAILVPFPLEYALYRIPVSPARHSRASGNPELEVTFQYRQDHLETVLESVPPPTGDPAARCKCWWQHLTTTTTWARCP